MFGVILSARRGFVRIESFVVSCVCFLERNIYLRGHFKRKDAVDAVPFRPAFPFKHAISKYYEELGDKSGAPAAPSSAAACCRASHCVRVCSYPP